MICCERWDGTKYRHPCACPAVSIIISSREKRAELCGFSEFQGNGIVASIPSRRYRSLVLSRTINSTTSGGCIDPDTGEVTTFDAVRTNGTATVVREYDQADCTLNNGECEGGYTSLQTFKDINCETTDITTTNNCFEPPSLSEFFTESTTRRNRTTSQDTGSFVSSTTTTNTLEAEDTESQALDRAEVLFAKQGSSIWQVRTTGFVFLKREVDYALLCTRLRPGVVYEGQVEIESREAVTGEVDEFEEHAIDTFSFTAVDTFEIVGGSLNSSVTVQEFKENNFSTSPSDYGLADDELVIIPSTALDHNQGYEYRLQRAQVEKR